MNGMTALLAMLNPYKWLILAGVLAAGTASFYAYKSHVYSTGYTDGSNTATVKYNEAISQQKLNAAALLADVVASHNKLNTDLNKLKADRELQDEKNKNTVATQKRRIDRLVDELGRLSDPHAQIARCGDGSAPTMFNAAGTPIDSVGGGAYVPGLLSRQLSDLLRGNAELADKINLAFASCKEYAIKARELLNGQCTK